MGNNQPKPDALEFAERLNSVLDDMEVPPPNAGRAVWLAKKFKVSKPSAGDWIHGESLPIASRVQELARLAGVNFEWLYFGRGPRTGARDLAAPESPAPSSHPVRETELTLALRLSAEAIGRDLYLPPEQHTDLVLTVLDLLASGMDQASVVPIVRRIAIRKAQGEMDEQRHQAQDSDR